MKLLEAHRRQITVFSGLSHPDVDGGHAAERTFLTGAPHPGGPAFRNTISLDQVAAEQIGSATRFAALTIAATNENPVVSVTRNGVAIPPERSPAKLYKQLFVNAKPNEIQQRVHELSKGRSLLDFVAESARQLQRDVGPRDRARLDQYFTSVRDLEQRMVRLEEWEQKPKPAVTATAPEDVGDAARFVEKTRLMLEIVRLCESGVPLVCVNWHNDGANFWDTHGKNFIRHKNDLMPPADRAFAALLEDLSARGLLDETLVVWVGEFGRAPKVTAGNAGREHWPFCYSAVLAGGGVRGGQVYGRSDAIGDRPAANPVAPADLTATVYHALGVRHDLAVLDRQDRPVHLTAGRPLVELF